MTTLTLTKLAEIEAAASKATPSAWGHRNKATGAIGACLNKPTGADTYHVWTPLYNVCDPATVAALCRIARELHTSLPVVRDALDMAHSALTYFQVTAICQADTDTAVEALEAIKDALDALRGAGLLDDKP